MPGGPTAPSTSVAASGTVTGSHIGTASPFTSTTVGAPVTHTHVGAVNVRTGPSRVTSSPGDPSELPRARLPRRKDRSSIGPDGGTPTAQ